MAMKTLYFKEHEGIVHNPIGKLSSVPWWSAFGSMEKPIGADQTTATKQANHRVEQGPDKGNTDQLSIFPGCSKTSCSGQKLCQAAISLQTALPEYCPHFDLGFGHPVIYEKYPSHMDQSYGVFSTHGAQISGRIMLPMDMATDDGPIYVNAKQYHGIMRRRKSRAKAVIHNKVTQSRKPYMHYSRHLHAMRRPRGSGGRFLNKKNLNDGKDETHVAKTAGSVHLSQPTGSQSSETLQSDSGTLNSSREANGGGGGGGSNLSGSEATSMYSREVLNCFRINRLGPTVHSFSGLMDSGQGIVMPSKWVAEAADHCCNLKV